MKKTLLSVFSIIVCTLGFGQTATNFTGTDCAGGSHDFFTEMDNGKVIVLVWAMPCGTCIGPSQSAYTTAQSFSSSHPGRVLFYMADDYANTACGTLTTWANTNSMPNTTIFSNATIDMMDYGSTGMPKVVVLGGASHTVFYNADDNFSASAISTAITNGLSATNGIEEQENEITSSAIYPNPANTSASISYSIESSSSVSIEIYNIVGELISSVFSEKQNAGDHKLNIDSSRLSNGIYFIKLAAGSTEKTIKLSVSH